MGTAFSLCVIDAQSAAAESAEEDETLGDANNNTNSNDTEPIVGEGANESVVKRNTTSKIKDGNRCDKCGKKLGLTGGYPCRCGGVYCANHRYSDRHECTYDYRANGAEQIRRDNPVVTADKVRKL